MGVDTKPVHADNPAWRDIVLSCVHEWLDTFMIAAKPCLARLLQRNLLPKERHPLLPEAVAVSRRRGGDSRAVWP
jgi:hypothetical protein